MAFFCRKEASVRWTLETRMAACAWAETPHGIGGSKVKALSMTGAFSSAVMSTNTKGALVQIPTRSTNLLREPRRNNRCHMVRAAVGCVKAWRWARGAMAAQPSPRHTNIINPRRLPPTLPCVSVRGTAMTLREGRGHTVVEETQDRVNVPPCLYLHPQPRGN